MKWIHKLILNIIKKGGKVPHKIAFIMDGNRRYAQTVLKSEKHLGHKHGLDRMIETVEWCSLIGINEVSVFALSLDNLKREKKEVDTLMNLAKEQFAKFVKHGNLFIQNGIWVWVLGKLEALPEDVWESLYKVAKDTEQCSNMIFNLYICYDSTTEMEDTLTEMKGEYSEEKWEQGMYGGYSVKPDILVRTSNEVRLSNFLLYQSKDSMISYI